MGEEVARLLERLVDSFYLPMERGYVRILGWSMRHRWVIVVRLRCGRWGLRAEAHGRLGKKGLHTDQRRVAVRNQHARPRRYLARSDGGVIAERIARDVHNHRLDHRNVSNHRRQQ